jgi:hypothetical protein
VQQGDEAHQRCDGRAARQRWQRAGADHRCRLICQCKLLPLRRMSLGCQLNQNRHINKWSHSALEEEHSSWTDRLNCESVVSYRDASLQQTAHSQAALAAFILQPCESDNNPFLQLGICCHRALWHQSPLLYDALRPSLSHVEQPAGIHEYLAALLKVGMMLRTMSHYCYTFRACNIASCHGCPGPGRSVGFTMQAARRSVEPDPVRVAAATRLDLRGDQPRPPPAPNGRRGTGSRAPQLRSQDEAMLRTGICSGAYAEP